NERSHALGWWHIEALTGNGGRLGQPCLIPYHPSPFLGLAKRCGNDAVVVHDRGGAGAAIEQPAVEGVEGMRGDLLEREMAELGLDRRVDLLLVAGDRVGRPALAFPSNHPFVEQGSERTGGPAVLAL